MGGDGDLLEHAEKYRQEKFARLAAKLEANRRRQAKEFDLLEFAVAIGDAESPVRTDDALARRPNHASPNGVSRQVRNQSGHAQRQRPRLPCDRPGHAAPCCWPGHLQASSRAPKVRCA